MAARKGKVNADAHTAAVVLAGGQGNRFGIEAGKQLVDVAGKPCLTWSLLAFDQTEDIGLIVVVCPEDRTEEYKSIAVDPYDLVTPVIFAPSGSSRQESAFSGLEYVPETYEFVLMHDGARPMIDAEFTMHVISVIRGNLDCDGAVVAHPSVDTLKLVEDGEISGTPDRRLFWNAQTPQIFRAGIYRRAHASALRDGFFGTDDSSLLERLGAHIRVVEGSRDNLKLTVPEDLLLISAAVAAAHAND